MKKFIPVFLFFVLVFIAGWIQHDDSDLYGHIAMGRIIAQQGIPHHEILSQAGLSRPYIPTEWLFQIGLYWIITIFGFASYHFFTGIFTVIQIAALYVLLKKVFRVNSAAALLLCTSYLLLNYQFFTQRPQIVAYLFLIIELTIIFKYILENKNYLLFLIPIAYIWTNIHASVFVSVVLCFGYSGFCFLGIFTKNKKIWLKKSVILFLTTIGIFVASIIPPQNFGQYQDLLLMYKHNNLMRIVNQEWTPLYTYPISAIYYSLFMASSIIFFLIIVVYKKVFAKSLFIIPLIVVIPSGYLAIRNTFFGYLIATIIVGWAVSYVKWSKAKLIIFIGLFMIVLCGEFWAASLGFKASNYEWPEKAANYIANKNIQGKMFNQFGYGNYLEYKLYPSQKVWMDGRAEPFFCCELLDWYNLQVNSSKRILLYKDLFDYILSKYNFSYALIIVKNNSSGSILSNMFEKNPQWFLIYKDNLSEIWVKDDGKNTELINKFKTNQIQQNPSSNVNIFSDNNMNITFSYPKNFQIGRINPQIIALANPVNNQTDNMLYVYSGTVPKNQTTFNMPFALSGKLKSDAIIPVSDFSANQTVYSDGKNETDFVILRKNQQIIIMRIPQNSKYVTDAINDFIDTVKLLH